MDGSDGCIRGSSSFFSFVSRYFLRRGRPEGRTPMTVGSLFSGIGGFDLAMEAAGFTIAFQVEIDPFCLQVLEKHWPETPRLRDVTSCRGSIGSSADSPAKTSRPPGSASGSPAPAQGSTKSSCDSSPSSNPEASSSKTCITPGASGCPCCGAPCGNAGMPLCRFACAPAILGPGINAAASSSWPTLTHQSYGSNRGGANGRTGAFRPSLPTLMTGSNSHRDEGRSYRNLDGRKNDHGPGLPTLTVCGNYNRKGASPTSGDGLATAVGGRLNPMWCEWYMGFPVGWTDVASPIGSARSATRSSRKKSSGSRAVSKKPIEVADEDR